MKIIVKTKNPEFDRKFYDEFLFIGAFYKRIMKNPKKKVRQLSNNYKIGLSICIGYILLLLLLCSWTGYNLFDFFCIGMFLILAIIYIRGINAVKKRLKAYEENRSESIFELTEKEVKIEKNSQKLMLEWNSIEKVLINHYSIAFIPKDETLIVIGISSEYKDEIIKEIKKLKKDELLVDNSNLYK